MCSTRGGLVPSCGALTIPETLGLQPETTTPTAQQPIAVAPPWRNVWSSTKQILVSFPDPETSLTVHLRDRWFHEQVQYSRCEMSESKTSSALLPLHPKPKL
ncbi:hypothetical protein GOBAR_DD04265 [Gossypium barbadense]|nr:hypothetical protein GOBAR_DD04265 [Gossypium barbadense]